MRAIFCFLFFFAALHAEEIPLVASLKNDPSVLIEGSVNAITGQPIAALEDLLIQGKMPISIRRVYLGFNNDDDESWVICPTLAVASSLEDATGYWTVMEPSGCPIVYRKEKTIRENGASWFLCKPSNLGRGWCNTSQGEISSRTDPNNNTLRVELPNYRHLIVHAADGTIRTFKKSSSLQQPILGGSYRLISERHPNGCWTLYDYRFEEENYLLTLIRTMNPSQTKTFAWAKFTYEDPKRKNKRFFIEGSDGQKVEYCFEREGKSKRQSGELERVLFSHAPAQTVQTLRHTQTYSIYDKVAKTTRSIKRLYERLGSISFPLGRFKRFHYYLEDVETVAGQRIAMQDVPMMISPPVVSFDPRRGRVKALSNPLASTHAFLYSLGKTSVIESAGRTDYTWDKDALRIDLIEFFSTDGALLRSERFTWDKGRLLAKSTLDAKDVPLSSRRFFYSPTGDILEEQFYPGNSGEYTWVRYQYAAGLPVREEHSSGLVLTYEYVPGTDLLARKSVNDRRWSYEYNEDAVVVRILEEDGHGRRLVTSIQPLSSGPYYGLPEAIEEGFEEDGEYRRLRKTVLSYTIKGNVDRRDVYDANGEYCYSFHSLYDQRGRLVKQTDALGQVQIISYDDCNNPVVVEEAGVRAKNSFDLCNRLNSIEKAGWITRRGYDERGRVVSETDPWGARTEYVYNALNQCIETKLQNSDLRRGYDALGGEILSVDAMGHATVSRCNAYGKPTEIIHPDGAVERFFYTLDGWLCRHVDPTGVETVYENDSLGRVRTKTIGSATERFEYVGGLLASYTDAEGNTRYYRHDGAGRLIEEEFDGLITQRRYDSLGRIAEVQEGDLIAITEYDLLDRVIEERKESASSELLRKICYAYDKAGNRTQILRFVNGDEVLEERSYDVHNRLLSVTNPLGIIETTDYCDVGVRKTIHTDAMGLKTIQTYDLHGRLSLIEQQKEKLLSREERFYDKSGNLTRQDNTVFSPEGTSRIVTTDRSYDNRNRLVELIEANEKRTRYEYTSRSEMAATIKPDGTLLSYQYSDLGHLERICSSDGTVDHRMRYNRLGYLLEIDGTLRSVDASGRLLSETFLQGFSVQNRYDTRGRKVLCEILGRVIGYRYNALDLQAVTFGSFEHQFSPTDLSGNLLQESLINGDMIRYCVDPLSRTTALESPGFSQQILEYDRVGNILRMEMQGVERSYSYDDLYQLTSESAPFAHDYRFDSLNNRLKKDSEAYEINALNQIASHMEYDLNGNPIRCGDTEYQYDALDRLISLRKPGLMQTFTYDSQHRRLTQTDNGQMRYFLYDGQNEIGTLDEHLAITELRILGDTPHAEIGAAIAIELQGRLYTPIHDLQGNVVALLPVGANDPPTWYCYSAFGKESILGDAISPWRFSSKRSEGNLVYFGRRYYQPEFGRWLTPDPAGFTDGMNLYAYVHNDPLTHFDEYGLFSSSGINPWGQLAHENYLHKQDISNYLNGGYKFENHYWHYTPEILRPNINKRPFGEIVIFTGIRNSVEEFRDVVRYGSKLAGGVPIHGIHMPTHGLENDLYKCNITLQTCTNSTVQHGRRYFQEASDRVGFDGRILACGHSAGAMNAYFAAVDLPKEIRNKIIMRAIAPAKIIPDKIFRSSRNYMSSNQDLLMEWHKVMHKEEYYQALNNGLLVNIPAHPGASKFNDHGFMSPTFQEPLRRILGDFTEQYYCR